MGPVNTENWFQRLAKKRVLEVLSDHQLSIQFRRQGGEGEIDRIAGSFNYEEDLYTIEVYEDSIVMVEGDRLFECYLADEHKDEPTLIKSFAARLDNFLKGQGWELPRDP